jgi:hypothetical protein
MTRRIDETDLLGWIEGDLSPERRSAVAQAMNADPSLRRRVEAMASDRAALRSLSAAVGAPRGLVSGAIEEAERLALLGESPATIKIAWYRNYRSYAAAAGLLLAVGAVAVLVRTNGSSPTSGVVAEGPSMAAVTAPAERTGLAASDGAIGELPIVQAFEKIDLVVSREDSPSGSISLPFTRHDGLVQNVAMQGGARVTPAAFSDALRLASVGRLTVRIQASDPSAVEAALKRFGTQDDHGLELLSEGADGSLRYAIEMDRTECEFARLVRALEQATPGEGQTFFDVTLLPAMAARSRTSIEPPRQVSGAEPRVSIQVLIAPDGGVSW